MKENLSILLVEDNILNQRITTFSLKKFNHEVDIANNGLEAVNKYREKTYDVILMDIMMPVMDGLEATFQIRKFEKENDNKHHTPVIAITANTLDNDRDKCLATGMDEYMAKPFDMNRLNEIFKELNIIG
ncbi:response regulator [Roseimarinus sediminis]|jgi:osomolarity two-component system sensor histidine kinase NIK1|uniref:response regulator n=1 Tax=Roseimarinus sediminis TaxID=1610899 RepID=UPI003D2463C5